MTAIRFFQRCWQRLPAGLAIALLALDAVGDPAPAGDDFAAATRSWQEGRVQRLQSEDGWLTLAGLHWLKPGDNRFGRDPGNDLVMAPLAIPGEAGVFHVEGGRVTLALPEGSPILVDGKAGDGNPILLVDDGDGARTPTRMRVGTASFFVVKRGDRFGIRVKDSASPVRKGFRGLEFYPPSADFRAVATLEAAPPGKTLPIVNILGMSSDEPSPGTLVFSMAGRTWRLDPVVEEGESNLFLMFADQTSGTETYGAGRYLYATPGPTPGTWIVDFNRAYSPPCAFTDFATCPLPPRQNRLDIAVTAGEKRYGPGH